LECEYKNQGKSRSYEIIECIPVKTDIIKPHDSIIEMAKKYVRPKLRSGDIVVCSEKAVAFSQGRVIDGQEVEVGLLAGVLSRFVTDNPGGVGLRDPRSMQVAIDMAGPLRIIIAAAVGGATKLFGLNGYFYRVAGLEVSMIDGAAEHRFEELQNYIVPPPENPDRTAELISDALGRFPVAIMDVNDVGGSRVVGKSSDEVPVPEVEEFMRYDNPLGQGTKQTPLGILRRGLNNKRV